MATRTIANGGGNWSANGTWVEGAAPTASDDVVATATSGNVTVNTTTCVAKSVDLTGYVGLLTFTASQILTVSGNVKFVAGMTLAGGGTLRLDTGGTLTSAGLTFPGSVTFNSASTWTLADDWTVTGNVIHATATPQVLNGQTLRINGSWTVNQQATGTTTIRLGGTGTWSGSNQTGVTNPIVINTSGTITISGSVTLGAAGSLTYTAGTMVVTGSSLLLNGSCTLDTSGMTWNNVRAILSGSTPIITLASNLIMSGALGADSGRTFATAGNFDITCATFGLTGGSTAQIKSGQTLTVTTTLAIVANKNSVQGQTTTLRSTTTSSPFYLKFQGTASGHRSFGGAFTDADASTSTIPVVNWCGDTLTRTTNIVNVSLPVTMAAAYCGG